MGEMKSTFAPFLAKLIYRERIRSNKVLVRLVKDHFKGYGQVNDDVWIQEQIEAVKKNPGIYKRMA